MPTSPALVTGAGRARTEEPQITVIEDVTRAEFVDAWRIADDQSVVQGKVVAEVQVEGYVFKQDYWGTREDLGLEILDSDHNRHYMAVYTPRELALTIEVLLQDDEVERFDVIDVESVDAT